MSDKAHRREDAMRKLALSSASGVVILAAACLGAASPASAQEPPPVPDDAQATAASPSAAPVQSRLDDVVVTGSNIRGTPEDAALPVEVYTREDMEAQGSPTVLEFAKNLTISGPTTGESYYFGGPTLVGSVNFNLRGLGADKTLVLPNGRRTNINTGNVPFIALARTELLKDGAAVIYGADATGGVVNFITRPRFTGLETQAQYKYIDGSDGDYSLGVLGGVGEDRVNFLWSVEYE